MNKIILTLLVFGCLVCRGEYYDKNGVKRMGIDQAALEAAKKKKLNDEALAKQTADEQKLKAEGKQKLPMIKVVQVTPHGILFNKYINSGVYAGMTGDDVFLLKNYPQASTVVDGQNLRGVVVRESGIFRYQSTFGLSTIKAYDCSDEVVNSNNKIFAPVAIQQSTPVNESVSGESISILEAKYGVGSQVIDVSEFVNKNLSNGKLRVGNDTLGGDPASGQVKSLTIKYKRGEKQAIATFREGETIQFSKL
jgi:hypothetical protein